MRGHSHWHDSFIVGDGVHNVTIRGAGTIDGGHLSEGKPKSGGGCRLLALRSCQDVSLLDFHTNEGGWFTLLATDVDGLRCSRPSRPGTRCTSWPTRNQKKILKKSYLHI